MKTLQHNEELRFKTRPLTVTLRYILFGLAINSTFPQLVLAEETTSSNAEVFFSIERGDLGKALEQFASQTGLNLSYEPRLISGKTTAGIQGEYLTPEALNHLIRGTGLTSVSTSTGFKIQSRPEQTSSMQMPSITITADAIENSYQPSVRLNTATRSSASVFETPQAIDVVSATSILDRGADSLTSALDYTPGVTTSTGEGTREQFIIRGFSAISDTYVDGMRDAGLYFRDTFNLEQIQVVKGPAGVLYGRGSAGGMINLVSKRATDEEFAHFDASYGSYNSRRITADLNMPVTDNIHVRVNAMREDADSFRSDVDSEKRGLAIATALHFSPDTSLDLQLLYSRDKRVLDAGIPGLNGKPADVDISTYYGAADAEEADRGTSEEKSLTAEFNTALTDTLKLRNTFRYREYDLDRKQTIVDRLLLNTSEPSLRLARSNFMQQQKDYSNKLELISTHEWAGITHEIMFGGEYMYEDRDALSRGGNLSSAYDITVYDPVLNPVPAEGASIRRDAVYQTTTKSLYIQDLIRFNEQWSLLAGIRKDWLERDFDDLDPRDRDVLSENSFNSPRLGLVYQHNDWLSFYASASKSYQPGGDTGVLAPGDEINPPEISTNYEVGSKFSLNDGAAIVTVSVFELTKENVPTRDRSISNSPTLYIGEVTAKGIEISATGEVGHGFSLQGGVTYTDAEVTSSNDTTAARVTPTPERTPLKGKKLDNTPNVTAKLWGIKRLNQNWRVGLGVRYESEAYADTTTNDIKLPSFTVFDSGIYYSNGQWNASLLINNITDKKFYESATNDRSILPGTPRTALLNVGYSF